ncbi:hypothetical protein C1166_00310 [Enterobacter bugandensis]|uniref:Serine/threonine protein kinase n=1 Tax=Enterobacter bugandensis TaxID=881260 RepID=A0ABX4VJV6_9ENTR|nr:hypothetical protein CYJ92_18120 [Enterobacter bugandensis]PLA87068.1 hypothetical protein CYK27_18060 [Enterobacter bugandensis]PNF44389.1 hypothetical protein C1166_00310 [Enterobacter bugandensis]PNF53869.1 hypothetical protein C1169_04760 [Enterobacter bugandensis]PNF62655.1 hypothetical protein C1168_04760 [Enterobacter bugandensis]
MRDVLFFHYSAITIALFPFWPVKPLRPSPLLRHFHKQATSQCNRVNGEGYVFNFWRTGY